MIYFKPIKITIDASSFTKVINTVVLMYHSVSNLIIVDKKLLFTSKFWLFLFFLRHQMETLHHFLLID